MSDQRADAGWVPLGPSTITPAVIFITTPAAFVAVLFATRFITSLAGIFLANSTSVSSFFVALPVSIIIVGLGVVLFFKIRYPRVAVNRAERRVRSGLRACDFAEVRTAKLAIASQSKKALRLVMTVEGISGFRAIFLVRGPNGDTLSPADRELVLDVLRGSSIDYPTTSYDPKNAFARYNFPDHLDKDDAIRMIEHPPKPGDTLPTGSDMSWR